MKTAFIFPGQGAQYIGMAQDYLDEDKAMSVILDDFDRQHQTNLRIIMAEGPEELLKETRFTQPAILFHSMCALTAFRQRSGLVPDFVAGHSLGEFTALAAAGVLSINDAMHIVHKRGEFMIRANAGVPFAMSAIIGLNEEDVIDVCSAAESVGLVRAVNFNTPVQTVISGTEEGVSRAGELAREKGAKRVIPLVVGGPFHTPLIQAASAWLDEEMQRFSFGVATFEVVSNVDARPSTNPAEIHQKLVRQIISPVRWVQSVQFMINQGVDRFMEFGPQKVLSGMIRSIDKDVMVINIDKLSDVDTALEQTDVS